MIDTVGMDLPKGLYAPFLIFSFIYLYCLNNLLDEDRGLV